MRQTIRRRDRLAYVAAVLIRVAAPVLTIIVIPLIAAVLLVATG